MTRQPRNFALFLAVATVVALTGCRSTPRSDSSAASNVVSPGGELVVSVRTDPQSFLWFTKRDGVTQLVTFLTQARLVRVDRATQNVEPWLAESWTRSADGRQYTVKLRPGISFSDGHPFTSDDVLFSFRAAYDEGSVIGDSLQENGKRLQVAAPDPTTVVISFAEPFGPGLRILDNLPIVPRHKLEAALKAGTFARAWGVSTPPQDMAGLGPFVLTEYVPGQRLRFSRNARYFRKDANGIALPYVDRVLVQVAPDQDTELLRLDAGQVDMSTTEIRPEDYAPLRRAADAGRVQLFDLGAAYDPDSLWFNLKPGGLGSDPRAAWLQRDELRRAVSLAVNRQLFADTVYLGAATPAFGPITTANKPWYSPDVPHTSYDPARAKLLLASIGLTDRNGDGVLEDARGEPARFTLLTQKGLSSLERGAAVIRDELKKIGLVVDVVSLEGNAVIQRFLSGHNYDAVYFRIATTDTDPAINLDFWLSSGTSHVWNLAQATPATPWERQIDELMTRQMTSSDEHERKRLFDEVQKVFAEYLPIIHFAAARVYVAASARVTHVTPAVLRPQLLWSPDTIAVRH